jgi:hypothetical protein
MRKIHFSIPINIIFFDVSHGGALADEAFWRRQTACAKVREPHGDDEADCPPVNGNVPRAEHDRDAILFRIFDVDIPNRSRFCCPP